MAAPSQFSDERVERIVDAVKLGASREGAASCAGIAPSTLYDWIRRGKAGEAPYARLWDRIETEQRAWEVEALKRVHKAAENGTWQAAAWLLERRLPKLYARRMDDSTVDRLVERRLKELQAEGERKRNEPPEESYEELLARAKSNPELMAALGGNWRPSAR